MHADKFGEYFDDTSGANVAGDIDGKALSGVLIVRRALVIVFELIVFDGSFDCGNTYRP